MKEGIKNVGVVGLGVMGFDIAFLYAMRGYRTLAYDASNAVMESFTDRREKTIERLKRRERISDSEAENVRQGLKVSPEFQSMETLDFVTEAVSEVAKTKLSVYTALREIGFTGILTTNTSSLPRDALLAGDSYERKKFATTHFFNPVLYTQMVEVVEGDMEESSFNSTLSFLRSLGRNPVQTRDISGFVSNGILMYYSIMALHLLQCGARFDEIDQAARRMGCLPPFVSFDSWKPSIVEDVTRVMFEFRGDKFLRSSKLLSVLARRNPSFYVDQKPNPEVYEWVGERGRGPDEEIIKAGLKTSIYAAAARIVELGEDPSKVDLISLEGLKIPQAPLKEIDRIGAAAVLKELSLINHAMPDNGLTPPEILLTMANQGQTFYENDQTNPWILSFVERQRSHAGH
jgi:3-hydroxyacyl-CoA dehydrogenase